jgi:hypothetical protein
MFTRDGETIVRHHAYGVVLTKSGSQHMTYARLGLCVKVDLAPVPAIMDHVIECQKPGCNYQTNVVGDITRHRKETHR